MSNQEQYPEEFLPDPADVKLSDFRAIAEFLFIRNTTPSDRQEVRRAAAAYRIELEADGVDMKDLDDMELLWQGWYLASRTWQPFILGDLPPLDQVKRSAIRAMQWSGMVLLLTTEPNTPEPESTPLQ